MPHRILIHTATPAAIYHLPALALLLRKAEFDIGIAPQDDLLTPQAIRALTGKPPVTDESAYDAALAPYGDYAGALPRIPTSLAQDFDYAAAGCFRLPSPEHCLEAAVSFFTPQDYAGKTLLLTAGPTIEDADPARYVSNRSTGRMGSAIARMAARRGARVILVYGPMQAAVPAHQNIIEVPVRSATQMLEAVDAHLASADIAILCAAVADFSPLAYSEEKIKKGKSEFFTLRMKRNPDILAHIGALPRRPFLVGFAAESNDVSANAQEKMNRKNCDMLCANDITAPGCGFATATNSLTVFRRNAPDITIPLASKENVATQLLDIIHAGLT